MGNLLLAFPELRPEDFLPWVDPTRRVATGAHGRPIRREDGRAMARRAGRLGPGRRRITRFRDAVDLSIYTPGSRAGLPLTVLRSFDAPPPGLAGQAEAYRERIASAVSGLLALVGIDADPISSREHILISNILDHACGGA